MKDSKHKALDSRTGKKELAGKFLREVARDKRINREHAAGKLHSGDRGFGIFKNRQERDKHDSK